MQRTNLSRSSANIKVTVENHINILRDILPAHFLTGCDTVSYLFEIGKATEVKRLGFIMETISDVITEATNFFAACYGYPQESSMTTLRNKVWI